MSQHTIVAPKVSQELSSINISQPACTGDISIGGSTNEGFRNRRSYTINSRDDVKGVHQLSNKRKLSITMETTNEHRCHGDVYSYVFEHRVESSQDISVVDIEAASQESNTSNSNVSEVSSSNDRFSNDKQ